VDLSSFYLDIVKDRLYAEGVDSPRRRATQTVLHRILDTLVVLISPVLSHLAEDIHLHLPPAIRGAAPSVFLRDWPSLEAFPRDAGLAERWGRIQEIRDEVMRALEQARQSKAIGRGAEADVVVEVTDVHRLGLLQDLGDLLKDVLMVASARVELVSGEPVTARVSPTKAPKCERCWNHDAHVGTRDRHPTLCPRCTDVMEQLVPTC
jgi:isoleucyl-tRNA synthetase